MPIHDQGYRRYQGTRLPLGRGWAVIAKTGIRTLLKKRAFLGLLLLAWFPFFVRAVQIYASANLPQAAFLAATPEMFRQFLGQQEIFLFFITVYAGAGLIANDRRANALQIYLSKPITRFEYIAGKLAVLAVFLLLVSWLPALMLLLIQVMFSGSFNFFTTNLHLIPAITVFSIVQVLTISSAMLALSSLSKSSRYVAVLYAGLIFFSQAMYGVLYAVTRSTGFAWIAMPIDLSQIGDFVFRIRLQYATPVSVAMLVIGLIIGASAFILERRVRGIEVVA
jgi:ABC-2 type transport system permease protein